jgi:hypothetical protein
LEVVGGFQRIFRAFIDNIDNEELRHVKIVVSAKSFLETCEMNLSCYGRD